MTAGDLHAAEDLAQDVLLKMREQGGEKSEAWLILTARNLFFQWLRERKREAGFRWDGRVYPDPASGVSEEEIARALLFVRDGLTRKEARYLRWRRENRSRDWIARKLGVTLRTVQRSYAELVMKVRRLLDRRPEA
jgi:DNA-directed RNA polymerase specialized sigma24 family protein